MKFLKGYVLGFATCWLVWNNSPAIIEFLERQLAKLELKRDILEHDNPSLRKQDWGSAP